MGKRPKGSSQPSPSSREQQGRTFLSCLQQKRSSSSCQEQRSVVPLSSRQQHLSSSQQQQQQQPPPISLQHPLSSSLQQQPTSSSHEQHENSSDTRASTAPKRKGKGLSKKTKDWGKKKLIIEFNDLGQPMGDEWIKLATQMGFMIKNGDKFPLTVEDWPQIEQAQKDSAWQEIKDNTNLTDEAESYVISNMGGQWKDWKERVKRKGYNAYEIDEERLSNRPEGVAEEQWPVLVAKWGKEEFLKISAINKENRSKQGLAYRLGRKPLSIFREERAKAGLPTDRLSIFLASRANNDGRASDPDTQEMLDAINEALKDIPEEERNDPAIREKIFTDHLGKDGRRYMRCMGHDPTITSIFGRGASSSSQATLRQKVDDLETKLVSQNDEFNRRLEDEREANRLAMEAEREANRLSIEAITTKIMSQFQNASPSRIVPTGSSGHPAQVTCSSNGANEDTP